MPVRVAINGFGRIGRLALRSAFESGVPVTFVGINDVADVETLAHLLRHDTVYGPFGEQVAVEDGALVVGGHHIPVHSASDPAELPWRLADVDVVLECTGKFRTRDEAAKHLEAGARKVILSAPGKDVDVTVVRGVNDEDYDPMAHDVVSNASCTTNCLAPVVKVLHEAFGIRHGQMTTIHAVTGDQRLVDTPHKDPRRARSAIGNIIPTTTGAAKAIGLVMPELEGKLRGYSARVPVLTGSLVDLTVELERPTNPAEINAALAAAAFDGPLEGILEVSGEPLVSSDVIRSPFSSIVDASLTDVVDGTQAKVVAWYDNEWGYATRFVELAQRVATPLPALR